MYITRHVDGTVKFWDTSSLTLQVLYRLKTSKVFEKSRTKTLRPDGEVASTGVVAGSEPGKQYLAIKQLALCPENRLLAIAGASGHVILFKFRRQEASLETTVITIIFYFKNQCIMYITIIRLFCDVMCCASFTMKQVLDVPLFFESSDDPQGSPSFGSGSANLEFCPRKVRMSNNSIRLSFVPCCFPSLNIPSFCYVFFFKVIPSFSAFFF